jgi:hypothetical protein
MHIVYKATYKFFFQVQEVISGIQNIFFSADHSDNVWVGVGASWKLDINAVLFHDLAYVASTGTNQPRVDPSIDVYLLFHHVVLQNSDTHINVTVFWKNHYSNLMMEAGFSSETLD